MPDAGRSGLATARSPNRRKVCHDRGALKIVLAAAATCEATINTYLALKLPPEAWSKNLEKQPTAKKWTEIVSKHVPGYSLPLDGELGGALKALFSCRDAIVHAKPQVKEGLVEVHPGNVSVWMSVDDAGIAKFYGLTPKLLDNLAELDWSVPSMLASMMRTTLALPPRDVYRRLRRRLVLERYRDRDKDKPPN